MSYVISDKILDKDDIVALWRNGGFLVNRAGSIGLRGQ
jgi:hypothetical protein